jgi:putative DNA primase/helicase
MVGHGEGCNGKSVACAALAGLLGTANVSNVPLERFGDRFSLASTLGRLANIAREVGEIEKVAEGQLKAITSGDPVTFERKYLSPIEAVPTARLVFSSNNRPRFLDRSNGIWRRILLVPFRVEIKQEEKVAGMDKVTWWEDQGELPGLLNWALTGLQRLRKQGKFTDPDICRQALAEYRTESNPVQMFLEQNCLNDPAKSVEKNFVRKQYQAWCKLYG